MKNIELFGISHKTAEVYIRERYSFTNSKKLEFLNFVKNKDLFKGLVLLSTCNRTEIYFEFKKEIIEEEKKDILVNILKIPEEEKKFFYYKTGKEVFLHLSRIISGIDSQVLGETEIVNQVKYAYKNSFDINFTSKNLNFLFQNCFKISKKVRSLTGIQEGNLSYGSIISDITKNFYGENNISVKNIAIIGTGMITKKIVESLHTHNLYFVSSKHYEIALELAKKFNGIALKYDNIEQIFKNVDIIIAATSAPKCIITEKFFSKQNKEKILIFDLGVPRNVSDAVKKCGNVTIYTLDDLNFVKDENYKERMKHKVVAEKLINFEVNKIWEKLQQSHYPQPQLNLVVGQVS
jgi:glutamyl-tRNA reductase